MYPVTKTLVQGTEFVVASRYRIIKQIGTGAYGVVASAEDVLTGRRVAIKKVPNAFADLVDAKRILREIKLMRHFGVHENLVHLLDLEEPPSLSSFNDIYIITELMETDLHRIIYSKQKLTDEHVQYFLYQILRALKFLHSASVIHRDIKPSNILLNANCDLRICDFGLARGVNEDCAEGEGALTEYVVTRWYRAPEIMLGQRSYTKAVDVWAAGCILGELLRRKPLFAGTDYMDQLKLITTMLGSPSEKELEFVRSDKALAFMARHAGKPRTPWAQVFKKITCNPDALDLLTKMLEFNPAKRISVDEALAHRYMRTLHCPDDEPIHPRKFDFSFEAGLRLEKSTLQRLMYDEILTLRAANREAATAAAAAAAMFPPRTAPPSARGLESSPARHSSHAASMPSAASNSRLPPVGDTEMHMVVVDGEKGPLGAGGEGGGVGAGPGCIVSATSTASSGAFSQQGRGNCLLPGPHALDPTAALVSESSATQQQQQNNAAVHHVGIGAPTRHHTALPAAAMPLPASVSAAVGHSHHQVVPHRHIHGGPGGHRTSHDRTHYTAHTGHAHHGAHGATGQQCEPRHMAQHAGTTSREAAAGYGHSGDVAMHMQAEIKQRVV